MRWGLFNTDAFVEGDLTTTGGNGGVGSLVSIPLVAVAQNSTGVSAGDQFRLIWFDPEVGFNGIRYYGFISSLTFTISSDGSILDYAEPFVGVDPVRPAASGFLYVVPEPTAPLLGLLGMEGLIIRRRRSLFKMCLIRQGGTVLKGLRLSHRLAVGSRESSGLKHS